MDNLTFSHIKVPEAVKHGAQFKTIPEVLQHYAGIIPDKEAIVFVSTDGGRVAITFKDIYEKSKVVAHNLVSLGVKPKEVVAINLRTCPEWLYVSFGAMMAGAIPSGAAFTYKDGSDLIALMEKLEPCSCLVTDPGFEDENWNILSKLLDEYAFDGSVTSQRLPSLRYLICYDPDNSLSGVKNISDLLVDNESNLDLPTLLENDIACLFQTSGSTGVPKNAAHTHGALLTMVNQDSDFADKVSNMRTFSDRPFTWLGGYPFNLLMGETRVTVSGFCSLPADKAKFITDILMQEKCQNLFCLPGILHEVVAFMSVHGGKPSVETVITGGQPMTKSRLLTAGQFCNQIITAYGGTEMLGVSSVVISDPDKFVDYSGGTVMPGVEVKLVNDQEEIVPVNTCGEIYVRKKGIFYGYYNDKEKTAAVLTEDGWYKTDDLGRMLEDGSLMVEGRKSNMIISGGMNVAPEILETSIARCPGVESVVLVPVPDSVMYQVICACVKPVAGSDVNEEVVRTFCEDAHGDKLGLFIVLPKYYMFLDSFPETSTGKIARKALKARAEKYFIK